MTNFFKRFRPAGLLIGLALSFGPAAHSQDAVTGVTGTVTDQSGAVIPAALVKVTSASGQSQNTTSDGTGIFSISGLAPGTYSVSVTAPGFKEFQAASVTVVSGQLAKLDASLNPADATASSVDVVGGSVGQVETGNSELAGTITQKELVSYGLNGRNFTQLIALAPGVSNQTGQDEAKVGVVGSVKYSVNGGRVEYNTFDVDGSDLLNVGINGADATLIVYPSLDAIQEVKVLTSNYGAMYGRTASGTVLVATKSGTDQFHGNGYFFGRNELLNARNFFDETKGAPLYRRDDVGGTIGGPLYIPGKYNTNKDKTFFFFSEEYRYEKSPIQYNQAVPSMAERSGNFSDVCPASKGGIFLRSKYPDCPGITPAQQDLPPGVPGADFPLYSQAFENNQIPYIDKNAAAILQAGLIPAPNSTTGCNSTISSCYATTVSPLTNWREELFRIDHNFNSNTRGTFRFIHDSWDTVVSTPQWGSVYNSFPTVENNFIGPGISLLGRLTQTLTPKLINDISFSYGNSTITLTDRNGPGADLTRPAALDSPCASVLGAEQCPVGYLFNNGFGGKIPGIVIQGTNAEYGGTGFAVDTSYMPWHHTNPAYSIGDSLSWVVGKHNFQMGGQWIISNRDQTNGAIGAATGDLQGILTFGTQSSTLTTGNAFADFLFNDGGPIPVGGIKSYSQDSAQLVYHQRYQLGEPYFQDDWRVTPHLTVNLGLRVSLFGTYHEANDNAYNWVPSAFNRTLAGQVYVDPSSGNLADNSDGTMTGPPLPLNLSNLDPRITNGLVRCGTNGVPSSCMKGHLFNPAPRVGFAWDPTGAGKMSLRGGYGMFFEHGTGNEANTGSLEASAPLVINMTQPHPIGWGCIGAANSGVCGTQAVAFPLNVTSIPTKAVWPYVQQWSLSFQAELPRQIVATAAYVGSKGTHLTDQRQLNQLAPVPNSQNPFGPHEPILPVVPTTDPANPTTFGDCGSYIPGQSFQLTSGTLVPQGSPALVNLLAACSGTTVLGYYDPNSLRQFAPGIGNIIALENSANSSYNAFQTTARRVEHGLTLGVSYTFSRSRDDSSDRSDNTFVNSFDLRSNYGPSNFDQRHLLNISYIYDLPLTRLVNDNPSALVRRTLGDWQISGITVYQSGTPFSVINDASSGVSVLDNAGVANGLGAGSYPDIVGNPYGPIPAGGNNGKSFGPLLLNPGAFVAPRGLTFGDAGRNVLNNPSRWNWDMALLKQLKIQENKSLEFRFEAFNAFNHTQFRIYDSNLGDRANNTVSCYGGAGSAYSAAGGDGVDCLTGSGFLHPVDAHRPRTIQFGVKFAF